LHITCYGGDDILRLTKEHLPSLSVMAQLQDLQSSLSQAVTGSEVKISVTNEQTAISIAPKPGADALHIGLKIKIEQSPEGEQLHEQLKQFWHQGGSVNLPGSAVELTDVPDVLAKLGLESASPHGLTFEQLPVDLGFFSLIREPDDHERAVLENVFLVRNRGGQSSVELRTKPNSGAFEFAATVHVDPKGMDFSLTPMFQGRNVKEIHEVLMFELALGEPGKLTLVDSKTGLTFLGGRTDASAVDDYVSRLEKVVGQLVTIQQKTGRVLNCSRELTEEDLQQTLIVYAAVTAGSYQSGPLLFVMTDPDPWIEEQIDKPIDLRFAGSENTFCQILDTSFDLGRAEMSAINCTLSREKIDVDGHHLILRPDPGKITVSFPEWQQQRPAT
jgi:hypothetical protein